MKKMLFVLGHTIVTLPAVGMHESQSLIQPSGRYLELTVSFQELLSSFRTYLGFLQKKTHSSDAEEEELEMVQKQVQQLNSQLNELMKKPKQSASRRRRSFPEDTSGMEINLPPKTKFNLSSMQAPSQKEKLQDDGHQRLEIYFTKLKKSQDIDVSLKEVNENSQITFDANSVAFVDKVVHALWSVKNDVVDDLSIIDSDDSQRISLQKSLEHLEKIACTYQQSISSLLSTNPRSGELKMRAVLRKLAHTLEAMISDIKFYL